MTSSRLEFKLLQRGFPRTLLLIPGWATDYRIFSSLELPYNYLLPVKFAIPDFEKCLLQALDENKISKISILGWSMGAFMAADFAARHKDRIDAMILAAVRRRYGKEGIRAVRSYLARSPRAYLSRFYKECRVPEELKKIYLEEINGRELAEGLDYLSEASIAPARLKGLNVKFVHGEKDGIAPIDEARTLHAALPGSGFAEIKDAGHFPCMLKKL